MINENSLLGFIFSLARLWLNSWLCSRHSNLRWFLCSFIWSHYSVALNSGWLLVLMKFVEHLLLLLYYGRWANILFKVLLIFFIFVSTWSEILILSRSVSWRHNLLTLDFDIRPSFSIFVQQSTSCFLDLMSPRFIIDHMRFKRNSSISILKFNGLSFGIISIPLTSSASVAELVWKLTHNNFIVTYFTYWSCWGFPFLLIHDMCVIVE
jgi:hypothetical protein